MEVSFTNNINTSKVMNEWDAGLQKALTDAAKIVEDDAKSRARGHGKISGSISKNVTGNVATIGSDLFYAKFLETGTGIFSVGGGGRKTQWFHKDARDKWHRTHGQRPRPFLGPALLNNRAKIFQCFSEMF